MCVRCHTHKPKYIFVIIMYMCKDMQVRAIKYMCVRTCEHML